MLCYSKNILKLRTNINSFLRHMCNSKTNVSGYNIGFTEEESNKLLHVINSSDPQDLLKLKLPVSHVKHLIRWRTERGSFKTLADVLQIDDMAENTLRRVYENIDAKNVIRMQTSKKHPKNIISPDLTFKIIHSLQSAVSIHFDTIGISWCRLIKKDNTLTHWIYEQFNNIPEELLPYEIFDLAYHIVQKTPPADIYIFEALPTLSIQAKSKPANLYIYNQKVEMFSMLLALLNTSKVHNKDFTVPKAVASKANIENKVFYLRSYVPARLFNTFIGSEKVSAISTVSEFLMPTFKKPVNLCCTSVSISDPLKHMFVNQTAIAQDLLSQSLMLGCSFMDLYVHKNQDTINAIQQGRKKNRIQL